MSWDYVRLRYVTHMVNRGTAPDYVDDGPIRMVSQAANQGSGLDWSRTRFHSHEGNPRRLKGYLEPGDSLVNSTGTGTLGRIGWFDSPPDSRPCVADGHVTVVRFNPHRVIPKFGHYHLKGKSFQDLMFETSVTGSTNQIELNRDRLLAIPVPTPDLNEQQRIVDFLDSETSRLDQLSKLRQIELMKLSEHFESAVRSATGRDVCQVSRKEVLPLRRALKRIKTGGTPPSTGFQYFTEGPGTPWFAPGSFGDGIELGEPQKTAAPEALADRVIPKFAAGSILVVGIGATAGKVAYLTEPASGNQQVTAIEAADSVNPKFLAWQLWAARNELLKLAPYTTIPIINNDFLRSFPVFLPSRSEQDRVTSRIERSWTEITEAKGSISRQLNLLSERHHALITAAVTGQLDVTTTRSGVD